MAVSKHDFLPLHLTPALEMRDKAFDLYAGMEFSELDPAGLEFLGALHFSKGSLGLARKMF